MEQDKLLPGQTKNSVKLVSTVLRDLITPVPKTAVLVSIAKRVAQVHVHVHEEHQEIWRHKLRADQNASHVHPVIIVHLKILAIVVIRLKLKYVNYHVLMVMFAFKEELRNKKIFL